MRRKPDASRRLQHGTEKLRVNKSCMLVGEATVTAPNSDQSSAVKSASHSAV